MAGCSALLVTGRVLRPPATAKMVPVSQESAAPLIAPADVNLGVDAAAVLVTIPAPPQPAAGVTSSDVVSLAGPPVAAGGIGTAIDDLHVVANIDGVGNRRTVPIVLAGGDRAEARMTAYEPMTGLVLLEWTGGAPLRPLRLRASADAGLKAIVSRLAALAASGRGLPATLGLRLQHIDADLAVVVGAEGALVSALEPGAPAAGLIVPGDVVVAISDQPVPSVEAVQRAVAALPVDAPVVVGLRRDGKPLAVTLQTDLAVERRQSPPEPVEVPSAAEVLTAQQAASARVDAGARVLAIDGRTPGGRSAVQRELRRRRSPSLLYVQQDGERFFRVLPR